MGPFPLAAKAKEEAARQVRLAEAARRAGPSSAAKRKATEDKEAAEAQEDAKLKAPEAEAEAIANAAQEVNAQAVAQQAEAKPTPSKKSKEPRFGPRLAKCRRAGLSVMLGMCTNKGGMTRALAKGLPALTTRPSSTTKGSAAAPLPNARSATSKALP